MKLDRREKVYLFVLISLSLFTYFVGLDNKDLWGSSELRYAQVAKEMYEGGPWLTPQLGGEPYYNKPPLFFWAVASLYRLQGGPSELAARLPSALGALGTVILTYFLGRAILGSTGGFMAALILATSPKFHHYGTVVRLDSLYTFFLTLALTAFYLGYIKGGRHYFAIVGIAAALAVLTKGPLAAFFPFGIVFLYILINRDSGYLNYKTSLILLFVFLVTISFWAVPALLSGGEIYLEGFIQKNVIFHIATRAKKISTSYNYLLDIFMGGAPWAIFLPVVLYNHLTDKRRNGCEKGFCFLFVWFFVIFLGFALSFERRSPYLLPLYPAMSILVASFFVPRVGTLQNGIESLYIYIFYTLSVMVGIAAGAVANNPNIDIQGAFFFLVAIVIALFLGLLAFLTLRTRNYALFFLSSLITLVSCEVSQNLYFLPKVNDTVSTKAVGVKVAGILKNGDAFAVYRKSPLHYTFYTNAYPKLICTKQGLFNFLNSPARAYCLMLERDYTPLHDELQAFSAREIRTKENTYMLVCNDNQAMKEISFDKKPDEKYVDD